jgi:acyl transferase domain-containing protein/3-hydroxymyristoyl/3-hydroxydecanoyl-(acyl carrier protein) dehydratase
MHRRRTVRDAALAVSVFEPIAIIGQGCVLPGCDSPDALWTAVEQGRVLLSHAPPNGWRTNIEEFLQAPPGLYGARAVRTDIGGYVTTPVSSLSLDGLAIPRATLATLDVVVQWSVHAAARALADAKLEPGATEPPRAGVILGNLSYPTRKFTELHEQVVLATLLGSDPRVAPLNRFMSGLPALLTAKALGFAGRSFCLDAACASGLYAIKLACDQLQRDECDLMIAGGVNAADPLFIYSGFATLQALSQSGRSRPFHIEADGLIPSEGAACVVLKRLRDAERDGDAIAAVIRGVGLGNDGRAGGFLSPSAEGQVRAMRAAFAVSGMTPDDVTLIECHATGTATGDGVEVRSLESIYGRRNDLHLTALKANLGHSITTSAMAATLKMVAALRHGKVGATPNAFPALPAVAQYGYHVHETTEQWRERKGHRVGAISAFGMGGNNAHLILEGYRPQATGYSQRQFRPVPIAVVALAVRTDRCANTSAFGEALVSGRAAESSVTPENAVASFDPRQLASPPRDLERALGQQLLVLETAIAALGQVRTFDRASTSVLIGMQTDPEMSRFLLRRRLAELLHAKAPDADWLIAAREAIADAIQPADVVGTMPNIPANRINHQLDLHGPSFTLSAEEASGNAALDIAVRALEAGEITTAIVGAVDLCRDDIHAYAARESRTEDAPPADAAVVFVLKTVEQATADGDRVLTTLERTWPFDERLVTSQIVGRAHAAAGLIERAANVLAKTQDARLDAARGCLIPALKRTRLHQVALAPWAPRLECFAGDDAQDLRARVRAGQVGGAGPCRLALVGRDHDLRRLHTTAVEWLNAGADPARVPTGIHYRHASITGEIAFTFTGAASAYPDMGRELLIGVPMLLDRIGAKLTHVERVASWIYERECPRRSDPFLQLAGSSFLSQVHAALSQELLGIRPHAALGLSSGETNAMFALGLWQDMDGLFDELHACGLYSRELARDFSAVRRGWNERDGVAVEWENWVIGAPLDDVRRALAAEPRAYLTIINTPEQCVIAGDRLACARVRERLGAVAAVPLGHDIAVHVPAIASFEPTWRRIHTRPTQARTDVRMYSNCFGGAYEPTSKSIADALTGQAFDTIDFPRLIERAWGDGVRVFIEHGPRNHLTTAVRSILGDRPHLAVPFDIAGRSSLAQAVDATAALWVAGVPVQTEWFARDTQSPADKRLQFRLRRKPIVFPPLAQAAPRQLPQPPMLLPIAATTALASVAIEETCATIEAQVYRSLRHAHREYLERQVQVHSAFLESQRSLHAAAVGMTQNIGVHGRLPHRREPNRGHPHSWDVGQPSPPRGPAFTRGQLETLASGKISSVFGPLFEQQDGHAIQVRMPEPPLLLCDRVLGIEGEPGAMGRGTIWTETDVRDDRWYLHCARMPGGVFIEAGQADLLLISWLGADFVNRGERAYRLLGCELVFHDALPKVGETLHYEIHVDGHARQGDVRLFFFHYDCWINGHARISVRHGQAGFFTPQELASSGGVLWTAEDASYSEASRLELPTQATTRSTFSTADVDAFAHGDLETCFGAGFAWSHFHSRTPTIASGRCKLLGEVAQLDFRGGPARRGYLRAVRQFSPNDWFFDGHFKNDPCMPGTLMAEGCLQAMSFYLAALGWTNERDGWRFEPVPEVRYKFVCRGQATPTSRELIYELFVDEVALIENQPTLFAHVLCTVDGLKAFTCERLGLRLVRDDALSSAPVSAWQRTTRLPVAQMDGLDLDYKSLLACALGNPMDAFGPTFHTFARQLRSPRLPGPPFLFCTHVEHAERTPHDRKSLAVVDMLYDLDDRAWYFTESPESVMALCAWFETALQPCGWLSSYVLEPEAAAWQPLFRNLDGVGTLYRDIRPGDGTIKTRARLTSRTVLGEQIIVRLHVLCTLDAEKIFECTTTFGFFSPRALTETKGMTPSAEELGAVTQPANLVRDLAAAHEHYRTQKRYELPGPMLLRLDRITALLPDGGAHQRGYIRAEKDVSTRDWAFKAHFYQDPVQPGSIGVEAIMLAVKLLALETTEIPAGCAPRFQSALHGRAFEWTYRGQVLPKNERTTVDFDVTERIVHEDGVTILGTGRMWVDGKKIYQVAKFGTRMRCVPTQAQLMPRPFNLARSETLDLAALRQRFETRVATASPILRDLFLAMLRQFVSAVELEDPTGYARLQSQPKLYLANHQVAIESVLFIALVDLLNELPCRAIAKHEHGGSWIGRIFEWAKAETGRESVVLFDRSDPASLPTLLGGLKASGRLDHSLLVHVAGTRSLHAREPVTRVGSALIDFAIDNNVAIVPVRFAFGLPEQPLTQRAEFPHGFGPQRYVIGPALGKRELTGLNLRDRKTRVLNAINSVSPIEDAATGFDAAFAARVKALEAERGWPETTAVLMACLEQLDDCQPQTVDSVRDWLTGKS